MVYSSKSMMFSPLCKDQEITQNGDAQNDAVDTEGGEGMLADIGHQSLDDYAAALAGDPSIGTAKCPVGGADVAAKLAEILGVEAGTAEPQVAVVMCNGNREAAKSLMEYQGLSTCVAAKLV